MHDNDGVIAGRFEELQDMAEPGPAWSIPSTEQ